MITKSVKAHRLSTLKCLWTICSSGRGGASSSSLASVSSLLYSLHAGDTFRGGSWGLTQNFSGERLYFKALWAFPTCILKPFSVLNELSQFSHWKVASARLVASLSLEVSLVCFKNCSFPWRFLLRVEGLGFFFLAIFSPEELTFTLVSRLNENVEPRLRVKEIVCPMLVSAWQNSRHCDTRAGSPSLMVAGAIFTV